MTAGASKAVGRGSAMLAMMIAAVAVELMFSGFVLFGRGDVPPRQLTNLTALGYAFYLPERDLLIYLSGCVLAVVLTLRRQEPNGGRGGPSRSRVAMALTALSICTFPLVFVCVWEWRNADAMSAVTAAALFAIPIVLLVLGWALRGTAAQVPVRFTGPAAATLPLSRRDGFVCLGLFALVFTPRASELAGQCFATDRFHHWDFFAMAATLGYSGGNALGTETYSQYGVGWPMLFTAIAPLVGLGYAQMFFVASIYGAIYFIGVYLLLRRWTNTLGWAIAGTLLAMNAQLFTGVTYSDIYQPPLWQWPSSSVLRCAFDVWFFLALLGHARSGHLRSIAIAGALVGLAIVFGTDTGLYLAFAFVAYLVLSPRRSGKQSAVAIAAGILVLLAGLAIASRGTLFTAAFARGWLEVFTLYPSGVSMLPVFGIDRASLLGAIGSMAVVGVYLGTISLGLLRRCDRAPGAVDADNVVRLTLALYGAAFFIQYIGRSHLSNISHVSIPLAITLVVCLWHATQRMDRKRIGRVLLAVAVVLLLCNRQFWWYPNIIHDLVAPRREVIALVPGAGGPQVRRESEPLVRRFQTVLATLDGIKAEQKTAVIFANDDTAFHVYAKLPIWSRYSPLLGSLLTEEQLLDVMHEIDRRRPDYVLLPADGIVPDAMRVADTREATARIRGAIMAMGYVKSRQAAHIDVWRRPG